MALKLHHFSSHATFLSLHRVIENSGRVLYRKKESEHASRICAGISEVVFRAGSSSRFSNVLPASLAFSRLLSSYATPSLTVSSRIDSMEMVFWQVKLLVQEEERFCYASLYVTPFSPSLTYCLTFSPQLSPCAHFTQTVPPREHASLRCTQ